MSLLRVLTSRGFDQYCHGGDVEGPASGVDEGSVKAGKLLQPPLCISLGPRLQSSLWFCTHCTSHAYEWLSHSISHCCNMMFSCWIKLNQSQRRHQLFALVALYFPISNSAHKRINNLLNLIITLGECLPWYM